MTDKLNKEKVKQLNEGGQASDVVAGDDFRK